MTNITKVESPIKIIIVDDNFVTRAGLRSALDLEPDIMVLAEGSNGLEAVQLAQQYEPDVILLDFRMPRMDGVQATQQIIAHNPAARVLMLTLNDEPHTLIQAILAGAKGYLVHNKFNLNDLVTAVRTIHDGGALITPSLAPVLLDLVRSKEVAHSVQMEPNSGPGIEGKAGSELQAVSLDGLLTRRERNILELVQIGKSNREIAEALTIEEKTVKNHINSIYSKLHLRNRYEAITLRVG